MQDRVRLSLVTTVLNDKANCILFLVQMHEQARRPDEIVVVDGGSTDGTWEWLCEKEQSGVGIPLRIFREKGCNIARGRNLAIEIAAYDVIISTDVGCTWDTNWISELVAPMEKDSAVEAVMGSWEVDTDSLKGWGVVEACWMASPRFTATTVSHASSRSIAYRRGVWQKIGGYPEDLTLAADDMVFAMLLHRYTRNRAAASIPRVKWGRLVSLKSYAKEARRNFFGAGEAGIWKRDFVLSSGRLIGEILLLALGMVALLAGFSTVGIALILVGFAFVGMRILKLRPAVGRLACRNVKFAVMRLLIFDYVIKWYGMLGYAAGYLRGVKKCQNCRQRILVAMKLST